MTKYRIDYTLPDGKKRKTYIEAVPGTPYNALLSKAGVCVNEGIVINRVVDLGNVEEEE